MKINVTTGYGYVKNQYGVIMSKYVLPPGDHEVRSGYYYYEVEKESDLDSITVYPDVTQEYLNSKEYKRDVFTQSKCMKDLNELMWDRLAIMSPVIGLIDLWLRWKDFTSLKIKALEWVDDESIGFSLEDFDRLNDVLKLQGIDLLEW